MAWKQGKHRLGEVFNGCRGGHDGFKDIPDFLPRDSSVVPTQLCACGTPTVWAIG